MPNQSSPSEFDTRYAAPVFRWSSSEAMTIGSEVKARHVIEPDPSAGQIESLEALLIQKDNTKLVVILQGALGVGMDTPRFEWVRALGDQQTTQLFISDSSLDSAKDFYLSWYFGTETDDVQTRLATLIREVQRQIGAESVVLFGNSGGGYAALTLGQMIPGSTALAYNPQIFIDRWPYFKIFMQHRFGGAMTTQSLREKFPHRMSFLQRITDNGVTEKFVYVQNTGDHYHVNLHFNQTAEYLGLPASGGVTVDGKSRLLLEDHGPGHIPPPAASVIAQLEELLA